MKLLRRTDFPGGRFTLAFVGYGDESETTGARADPQLGHEELRDRHAATATWRSASSDIYATCARLREQGVKITREPGPMKHGTTVIAFVEDPDGYKIELIQGRTVARRARQASAQ